MTKEPQRLTSNPEYGDYREAISLALANWPFFVMLFIIGACLSLFGIVPVLYGIVFVFVTGTWLLWRTLSSLADEFFGDNDARVAECHSVYTEGIDYRVVPDE